MSRTRVPRVSLAVTILDDPEYLQLCQTPIGREAFALFCAMIAAAKNQHNEGAFRCSLAVLAMSVRWPLDSISEPLILLSEIKWITRKATDHHVIRNFGKWNRGWGGNRDGAGRKSRKNQDTQLDAPPASVSVTKDKLPSSSGDDGFDKFYAPYPRKVSRGAAERAWRNMSKEHRLEAIDYVGAFGEAWERYDPHRERRTKCPHPATWLNGKRWKDDPLDWVRMAKGE